MDSTLTLLIVTSILLLFLIFPLLFFLRRRVDLRLEKDVLFLEYPFQTRKIDLNKDLKDWKIEKAYYFRWGVFYSIMMRLNDGKQVAVSSLFNQKNFDLLFNHLNSRFPERKKKEPKRTSP